MMSERLKQDGIAHIIICRYQFIFIWHFVIEWQVILNVQIANKIPQLLKFIRIMVGECNEQIDV